MENFPEPIAMTVKDAAAYVGVSRSTIYAFLEELPSILIANGRYYVLRSQLDRLRERMLGR